MGNGVLYAQNAAKTTAIAREFSAPAIAVYQESSQSKVEDFYHYLSLLTTPGISPGLKAQIRDNIFMLFTDKETGITNFTSDSPQKITLPHFLDTIEKWGKTTFTIVEMQSTPAIFDDHWVNTYTLQIETETEITSRTLQQKIYFHPEKKKFGSAVKEIWALQLGEVSKTN